MGYFVKQYNKNVLRKVSIAELTKDDILKNQKLTAVEVSVYKLHHHFGFFLNFGS